MLIPIYSRVVKGPSGTATTYALEKRDGFRHAGDILCPEDSEILDGDTMIIRRGLTRKPTRMEAHQAVVFAHREDLEMRWVAKGGAKK